MARQPSDRQTVTQKKNERIIGFHETDATTLDEIRWKKPKPYGIFGYEYS
jgi:hypothetical protein